MPLALEDKMEVAECKESQAPQERTVTQATQESRDTRDIQDPLAIPARQETEACRATPVLSEALGPRDLTAGLVFPEVWVSREVLVKTEPPDQEDSLVCLV